MRTAGMALAGVCENPAADIRQIFGYLSFKRGASLLLTRRTASCSETASQFGDIPNVSWQKTKAITRHNGSGLRGLVKSGNALGGRSIIAAFIVYINYFPLKSFVFLGALSPCRFYERKAVCSCLSLETSLPKKVHCHHAGCPDPNSKWRAGVPPITSDAGGGRGADAAGHVRRSL